MYIYIYIHIYIYINIYIQKYIYIYIFYLGFLHKHSRFTGQKWKAISLRSLSPLYHFHPRHRHLDISRAITAESSPLSIASSRARTGNLWFSTASR